MRRLAFGSTRGARQSMPPVCRLAHRSLAGGAQGRRWASSLPSTRAARRGKAHVHVHVHACDGHHAASYPAHAVATYSRV